MGREELRMTETAKSLPVANSPLLPSSENSSFILESNGPSLKKCISHFPCR